MTEQLLGELHSLLNILLAVVLGFAIGYERKLRYKEAGIRTHTIVCVGSALIMVVSKYGFADIMEYDASRVAAQIVSGIGFLGAGIIIYRKHEIHGLTTAAGVWATAGVGMAAGAGMYVVAAGAAVVIIGVQCIFHIKCRLFRTKKYFAGSSAPRSTFRSRSVLRAAAPRTTRSKNSFRRIASTALSSSGKRARPSIMRPSTRTGNIPRRSSLKS